MKKTMALLLAIMMCLSLCACGEISQQEESSGKKEDIYAVALLLLEESQSTENASEKVKEAYELLVSLGEYEDAKGYLDKITQKELCVLKASETYDAFGQRGRVENISYKYDRVGRLLSESFENFANMTIYVEYDSNNRVSTKTSKINDTIRYVATYSYNDAGLCISYAEKLASGEVFEFSYEYDARGNCVKESNNSAGGIKTQNTYNAADELISKEKFVGGRLVEAYKYEYTYNENGNIQRKKVEGFSNEETYIHTESYTYDNGNLTLIETYDEKQNLVAKEIYTYETLYFYNP